jgi:hypothetical protein
MARSKFMSFSIFFHKPHSSDWIIERLLSDISTELKARGINVRCGDYCEYNGEDVLFHSRFLTARYDVRAKINSLFITHIDDYAKEIEVRLRLKKFNSMVCMSEHDAAFLCGLIGVSSNIIGIDLPCREVAVRPLRICVFSRCYNDNRKNEHWLLEYFKSRTLESYKNVIIVLLGLGWEDFASKLATLDVPYEIYSYPGWLRNEYQMYKNELCQGDLLVCMGFDGGQMSIYDGLQAGIEMVFPNISYHRGVSSEVKLYDTKEEFFSIIDSKLERQQKNLTDLDSRSVQSYSNKLYRHWESLISGSQQLPNQANANNEQLVIDALKTFKSNYKSMTFTRLRSSLIRCYQRISNNK